MKKYLCLFCCLAGLTHCVSTGPYKDFVVAQTALSRAKKSQADKLYPKIYDKAESFYKKGMSYYEQDKPEEAQTYFQESIKWAEKVEMKSRLKQTKEEEF